MGGDSDERPGRVKAGKAKRYAGHIRKIVEVMMVVAAVMQTATETSAQCPTTHHDVCYVDLAEMYAGIANPTKIAKSMGLDAADPAELIEGWDLSTPEGNRAWRKMVTSDKPMLIIAGYPCTNWCIYNRTQLSAARASANS